MATYEVAQNGANAGGSQGGVEAVLAGLRSFSADLGQALPEILAAVVIVILGILVASVIGNLVRRLVIWSRLENLIQSTSVDRGDLDESGIRLRVADIAKTLTKWLVILLAVAIAADILNWDQVTTLVNSFIAYLPNIAAAILLLIGGYLLGNFVGTLVSGMGDSFGRRTAHVFGNVVRAAIFVVAVMAALIQLGIAETIIQIAFVGLITMIALAGGLAFGLGGRDKARELLADLGPNRPMATA